MWSIRVQTFNKLMQSRFNYYKTSFRSNVIKWHDTSYSMLIHLVWECDVTANENSLVILSISRSTVMDTVSEYDMIQNRCWRERDVYDADVRTSNWFSSLDDRASLDRAIKPLGKQRHAAVDQPQKESLWCTTNLDECSKEQHSTVECSTAQHCCAMQSRAEQSRA